MEAERTCPNCTKEFGTKFRCDQCGQVFCDFCEAKKKIEATATHFNLKFFCPVCDGTATRIPMAVGL